MNREQGRASGPAGSPSGSGEASADELAKLFAAAVVRHQSGALADAERQYRHILSLDPNYADAIANLGLIALQTRNPAAAVEHFGKALTVNETSAEYHYNMALALRALNRVDDCAAHLERAAALRRDYALAHLNLGNVRLEQRRVDEAAACYERAIAAQPNAAAARFNLANLRAEQGRWDEAIAGYREALRYEPDFIELNCRLAGALALQGRFDEAIPHFERALARNPNLQGVYRELCRAYLAVGRLDAAIDCASRALSRWDTPQNKALVAQYIKHARFTADHPPVRALLLRALTEDWTRPRELTGACISMIRLNPAVRDGIVRSNAVWPERLSASELFGTAGLAALAGDELLCRVLETDPLTDIEFERLLTNVRCAMLAAAAADEQPAAPLLAFYAALARQCFINQYVYSPTAEEVETAKHLRERLEQALTTGAACPPLLLVAVAADTPLHKLIGAPALLERSWPQPIEAILTQQVREPAREREIAATIGAVTAIDDAVSRMVREQYEQSPYPRWVKNHRAPAAAATGPAVDVLIAGCGTGLSTIVVAQEMPQARILAVDLSLASLSYGKRMAEKLGLGNIEFAQADIMQIGSIGRQFDIIDASGVLHHLADPWSGWRVLLSLLRPGGAMQVGLYSDLARRNMVAARALIKERNYQATAENIRRCREDIIASSDPLLKSILQSEDFYATDECRDLLFNVQEHRISLREIAAFLAANTLQFTGFLLDAKILQRYAARFPDPKAIADLERWHIFETEAPNTFAAMYQFWVRKPAQGAQPGTARPS